MAPIWLVEPPEMPVAIRNFTARRGRLTAFRLMANAPAVFGGWARSFDELLDSPTLDRRLKELVIIRVAALRDSSYQLSQHVRLGHAAGLTPAEIIALLGGEIDAEAGFCPAEQAVLAAVTELCRTRRLTDAAFQAAHSAIGDEAFTELLMLVGSYYGLGLVVNALGLTADPVLLRV